jgi:hypothetical protein
MSPAAGTALHPDATPPADSSLQEVPGEGPFREPAPNSVWKRLCFEPTYDPFDVVCSVFEVRTKGAQVVPFVPFETQRRFVEQLGNRNITVKPRQVGMSTITLLLICAIVIFTPNVNVLIVTHLAETTETFRQTMRNWISWINRDYGFNIELGTDNKEQMEIANTGSAIYWGTPGGVGRSRTYHIFMGSELAHWDVPSPAGALAGMTESVPDNGLIFLESTPNGAEGPFYNNYHSKNDYVKHFFPWFIEPSRSIPLPPEFQLTLTDEERMLVSLHGLSQSQIAWRRWKKRQMEADPDSLPFQQEYPEDDITCFTAGVRTLFPPQRLAEYMRHAQIAHYEEQFIAGDEWDPGGYLRVWQNARPGMHYIVASAVGGGHRDGDLSYAIVRCHETNEHVASLYGHWSPERFADLTIDLLAIPYNNAYLAHEANGLGSAAVKQAYYVRKYPNYHVERRTGGNVDKDSGEQEWKPGFYIQPNARNPLILLLKAAVVVGSFRSYDETVIRQMTAARIARGRVGGGWADTIEVPKSVHDDGLMAYAQAEALKQVAVFTDGVARPMQVT